MKNKKSLSNIEVIIFNSDTKTLSAEKGVNIVADQIETESGILQLSDSQIWVDDWSSKIYYIFNVDIPAKVEAENLKKLRRSVSLTRIFDYDVKKPFDIFKLLPWLVIIALVVFK